eukprot:CAMPEP_0198612192 /NCGR_PEP_ID=MMETSP1462-20131121/157773_1 /TAXON_ID=1333877 /ORGANISM="Brandtodinium nutriculum, Strain RCC3387" /LENGTH=61 /DNA_ID=CAMNT_0044343995 /DNA_START=27 /DNA_END=212 /DNA_ORIENTATION=+
MYFKHTRLPSHDSLYSAQSATPPCRSMAFGHSSAPPSKPPSTIAMNVSPVPSMQAIPVAAM